MAGRGVVLESIESPCGLRCVDIVAAAEGGFAWASFRRDPEDGHGWRPDGWGEGGFETGQAARTAAARDIGWMGKAE